jgi:hypothetical protein
MAPLLSMLNVTCQILVSVTFCHYKSCLVELLAHALSYTPDMSHEPSKRKNVSGIMLVKVTTRPTEMHVFNRKNSQGVKNLLAPGLCHFESLCHYARLSLCPSSAERKYTWKLHEGALCCRVICFSNPWGRWVGDHAKEGLAKFGYRLERQVEKFRNPATCWQHARTYCLNMVAWAHFSL